MNKAGSRDEGLGLGEREKFRSGAGTTRGCLHPVSWQWGEVREMDRGGFLWCDVG
jgi:hypothetical protein